MARRKEAVCLTLDDAAATYLTRIARQEHEGNLSQTVRYILREAAERRGLAEQAESQEAQHEPNREAVTA